LKVDKLNIMEKKILFLILLVVLAVPTVASAQITIVSLINGAVSTAWIIATAVVVILWLVTGMLFLTAQGAPEKLNSARTALISAVAGTAIVVLAFSMRGIIEGIITRGT